MVNALKNKIRPLYATLKKTYFWQMFAFKAREKALPVYTNNNVEGIKLHIGSGEINIQGWINIDARKSDHVHIVTNEIKLTEFNNNSIQEIYLCHVLEHFSFVEVNELISLFYKKLKQGGVLRLSVPSLDSIIKIYKQNLDDIEAIKYALMGGQDYEYNFHKSVYNLNHLKKILEKQKFIEVVEWTTKADFGKEIGDWSSSKFKTKVELVDISLNMKATKV